MSVEPTSNGETLSGNQTGSAEASRMGELIMRLFLHMRQRLRQIGGDDINAFSLNETLVMWTIGTAGPMKFHLLSQKVGIPVSTLTTLVDRMEARGFLRRRPDTQDRRAIYVEGTPSLACIRERATALIRKEMDTVVAQLPRDQVQGLLTGLEALSGALIRDETAGSERDEA